MSRYIQIILILSALILPGFAAHGFDMDKYAESSKLSSGKWVKIKVEESGMHRIPAVTLRSWGFSDPSKVRVYGYGGRRQPDRLSDENYNDDLVATLSAVTSDGIVFYAAGPDEWMASTGQYYHGYLNPYTNYGYYFLSESEEAAEAVETTGTPGAVLPATTAQGRVHYEKETTQATISGPLFVGEEFSKTRTRTFNISVPGIAAGTDVWMECSFMHIHEGATAQLSFHVDGAKLEAVSTDRMSATSSSHYVHGSMATTRHTFSAAKESFALAITYTPNISSAQAWLDYLSFNYTMTLSVPTNGSIAFWSNETQLSLSGSEDIKIWDVTNPAKVKEVKASRENGRYEWTRTEDGMRGYVAWTPSALLPSPSFEENVSNQNLHGESTPVDMVIITPGELMAAANRIAQLHRSVDGMEVAVIEQSKIYNEFSSGAYGIDGVRKYLKFLYDLGAESDHPLQYAIFMGRATLDHREIRRSAHFSYRTVPWWVVRDPRYSMSDNDGYGTDDFAAMLADDSGGSMGLDQLSIAIGRIPALNADDANEVVDKLYQYVNNSRKTGWKNRMIVLADDEDTGVHLSQAENMVANFINTDRQQHVVNKIYIDAYEKVGDTYPEARNEMFRLLEEGMAWWIFTGHANTHSWTADGMLTFTDINNMYLRNIPFLLASTCDFLRWDGQEISGGELMYKERYGGTINMISATRPVYISDNGLFLQAFGRQALSRDENGRLVRTGEAYRRTKNDIRNSQGNISSNTNRLRFVFMGDPALALATPSNIVEITAINGLIPDGENQPTIAALSNASIEGRVVNPSGELMSDFNGVVTIDIFDADYSVTTLAHGEGRVDVYDRHGDKLFSGSATVTNGVFKLSAPMPSQIADNFREATMSLYAYATNSNEEAVGLCRDFFVYGFEEPATPDAIAPVIKSLVLNHEGFEPGDVVNDAPMVIAAIEDNVGINLSMAGVGQQMALTLDDFTTFSDVASFYTPSADGSPSGVINYPLENLQEGAHTLKLRVFDTSGNTTATTIDFYVSEDVLPSVFDVYTDANPASTSASFYVKHDRPESIVEVTITVYNLLGHPVWSGSAKGMSDNNVSAPVTWNLCDSSGRRVQRGIYLYRASISTDGNNYQSASRRIAVTAQ